jgi:hypothetical protein
VGRGGGWIRGQCEGCDGVRGRGRRQGRRESVECKPVRSIHRADSTSHHIASHHALSAQTYYTVQVLQLISYDTMHHIRYSGQDRTGLDIRISLGLCSMYISILHPYLSPRCMWSSPDLFCLTLSMCVRTSGTSRMSCLEIPALR